MSADRFEAFVRENLANGPWQYADGGNMGADAADFCDEIDALRAFQAAVPWVALLIMFDWCDSDEFAGWNDDELVTVQRWLSANAPREPQP